MARSLLSISLIVIAVFVAGCRYTLVHRDDLSGMDVSPPTIDPLDEMNAIRRFEISKGGDDILLPARVNGRDYQFIVFTAGWNSIFDTSIPLGKAKKTISKVREGERIDAKVFKRPEASFAGFPYQNFARVVSIDIEGPRQSSGLPIHGSMAMDFLAGKIFEIDFDRGELTFLKSVRGDAGTAIPIVTKDRIPHVSLRIFGESHSFVLDTAHHGLTESLHSDLFESAAAENQLEVLCDIPRQTAFGAMERKFGRAKELTLGDHTIVGPIFSESKRNAIGLNCLSRFVVTFDFVKRLLYLRPSAEFDRPSRFRPTGLDLQRVKDQLIVHSVREESAAAKAGILSGDELLMIDDVRVESQSIFELDKYIEEAGECVSVTVRRDGEELQCMMELSEPGTIPHGS